MSKTDRDKNNKHTLILVGKRELTNQVEDALKVLDVQVKKQREAMRALNAVESGVSGVAFIDPLPKAPTHRACRVFRNSVQAAKVPLFVISTDNRDDPDQAYARRLYREGATAVFEWPKERDQIPALLMTMLKLEIKSKPNDTDIALARAIRLRLKAADIDWGKQVREVVTNGIVSVSGFVDSLWKKRELAKIVADAPGVTDVSTWNLTVKTQGISDEEIAESVRNILENIDGIDLSTLALSVTGGRVRIVGTVRSHNESMRLIDIISQIRGVQNVENLTRASASEKENDSVIAHQMSQKIESLYPGSDVRVSLIGGVMVLSGTVQSLREKRQIGALASSQNAVVRTINKIAIAS
jgi:osmotically-inducible protein OsmY